MRWVSLQRIKGERILARHILDERGRILLARGKHLTPSLIGRLRSLGIGSVCVEDAATADIEVHELIAPELRQSMLEATYQVLTETALGNPSSRIVRAPQLRKRLQPLVLDVVAQLRRSHNGEHFGNVYLSDGELYHHSVNVALFALAVGVGMGLSERELTELGIGMLLHDIGKLKIPERVLKKPGKLSEEEYQLMKLHTSYGYEMLKESSDLSAASMLIALQHHERVDGTGYPRGLKKGEMHLFSRIAAVVDVYEALSANRAYRPAFLPHEALELLMGGSGSQFDEEVIGAFLRTISVYPVGMTVVLSNGYRGVVTQSPPVMTQRPVVRVLEDDQGNPVPEVWEVDLGKALTIQIVGCES